MLYQLVWVKLFLEKEKNSRNLTEIESRDKLDLRNNFEVK